MGFREIARKTAAAFATEDTNHALANQLQQILVGRRQLVGGPLAEFMHKQKVTPDENHTHSELNFLNNVLHSKWTRRGFDTLAVGTSATVLYLIKHPDVLQFLLHHPDTQVLTEGGQLILYLESQPTPDQLRHLIVNRGAKIDLEYERSLLSPNPDGTKKKLKIRTIGAGDSDTYTNGIMNDGKDGQPPDPTDQPNSFLEVAKNLISPYLDNTDVTESWESHTFAVPGAPSGEGFPEEQRQYGIESQEQFNNPKFQELLHRGLQNEEERKQEENVLNVVELEGFGDDWRELMQNALELANFFKSLEHIENATIKDTQKFQAILKESNVIALRYGVHIGQMLEQIAQINQLRREKGLLEIKAVIAHPFNMLKAKAIPFSTISGDTSNLTEKYGDIIKKTNDDPTDTRYYIDLKNIPYGNEIAYLITVAIYQQLSFWMGNIQALYPPQDSEHPWLIPLEWMGLEEIQGFFAIDGHPSKKGTPMQSGLLLNLFLAISNLLTDTPEVKTLDKIVGILPEGVSDAIAKVTQANAA